MTVGMVNSQRPSPTHSSSPPNPTDFGSNSSQATSMSPEIWRPSTNERERRPTEQSASSLLSFSEADHSMDAKSLAVLIRKLPSDTTEQSLNTMLLFAEVAKTSFVPARYPEDHEFKTAVAHFRALAGAKLACDRLNGKANLIVEPLPEPTPGAIGPRRNTVDGIARQAAAAGSTVNGMGNRSRFTGTFEAQQKMSPPSTTNGFGNGDHGFPRDQNRRGRVETSNGDYSVQKLVSPTSPHSMAFPPLNLGRNTMREVDGEDDPEDLLRESTGMGTGHVAMAPVRRPTNPPVPLSANFGQLSINTANTPNGVSSPPMPGFASPRSAAPIQSPNPSMNAMSPHSTPGFNHVSGGPAYQNQHFNQHFPRHPLPPVNPADQNPPCNTLYVGNLPMDTSEDELKNIFSKTRGYKRLCFRNKNNGPMCFVEYEDIGAATKILNELYGWPLSNSVKGGIRLSFSRNPLGVRDDQRNNPRPGVMNSQHAIPGMNNAMGIPNGFSTATGPPPGIPPPPGLPVANANGPKPSTGYNGFNNGVYSAGMGQGYMRSQAPSGPMMPVTANAYGGVFTNGAVNGAAVNGFHQPSPQFGPSGTSAFGNGSQYAVAPQYGEGSQYGNGSHYSNGR